MDADRYTKDVLEPAVTRKSGPPNDLWFRYALTDAVVSGDLARHLDEVRAAWKKVGRSKKFQHLVVSLENQDRQLVASGGLVRASLESARAKRRKEIADELDMRAGSEGAISAETFADLLHRYSGAMSEADLRSALKKRSLLVIDRVDVPSAPPLTSANTLPKHLSVLGHPTSLHFLSEHQVGARPYSWPAVPEKVTSADIERISQAVASQPFGDRMSAIKGVLGILKAALADASYPQLVAWELGRIARGSSVTVLPERLMALELDKIGVDPSTAHRFAVSVAGTSAMVETDAGPGPDVDVALMSGELRMAEELAIGLPPGDDRRTAIAALVAKVDTAVLAAERALATGDLETAAQHLASACDVARDDAVLESRLHAVPPPGPRNVVLQADGAAVSLRWEPSPVRVGEVQYRIERHAGQVRPGRGELVGTTRATTFLDERAPIGREVLYTVVAVRWDAESERTVLPPMVRAPAATGVVVDADERRVVLRWSVDPSVRRVDVHRRLRGSWTQIPDGPRLEKDGFVDTDVERGCRYAYKIVAVYERSDGREVAGPPVVVDASTEARGAAVTDLTVEPGSDATDGRIVVSWTPTAGGQVVIVTSDGAAPWAPHTVIAPTDLHGLKVDVGDGTPASSDRSWLAVDLGAGRHTLTAVTINSDQAIVGTSVTRTFIEPARILRADRLADSVRMSWASPPHSTHTRLRWWSTGSPDDVHEVELTSAQEAGGYTLDTGWQSIEIEVIAIIRDRESCQTSAPARTVVAGVARASYHVRRNRLRPRRRTVAVGVDEAMTLPALVVTLHQGRFQPLSPEGGEVLARIEPRRVEPDADVEVTIELDRVDGWLMCFPEGDQTDLVVVHPPVAETKLSAS